MGGLVRWKEHREVPDILWTLYEYPHFHVGVRSNMNNQSPDSTVFYGTEGTLEIKGNTVTAYPQNIPPSPEYYGIAGWPSGMRKAYLEQWHAAHPDTPPGKFRMNDSARTYVAPPRYDDSLDHMNNFLESVRSRRPPVEDANFGNVAAITCHMANASYLNKSVVVWDAAARKVQT